MPRHLLTLLPAVMALLSSSARADLPEVAFGPVFDALCSDLKASSECSDCTCTPITQSSPDASLLGRQPALAHAILVKLENTPVGDTPHRLRYFVALGSDQKLFNGGELERVDSTSESAVYTTLEVEKAIQFDDTCLRCDHEGVGLVHIFDVTLARTSLSTEDGATWETQAKTRLLVTCFGQDDAMCYATPLGMTQQKNRPSMDPADKGERGKLESFARGWKIGGRDKMQIVLTPWSGNLAKSLADTSYVTEPREFHFGDVPGRASTMKLSR